MSMAIESWKFIEKYPDSFEVVNKLEQNIK